MILQFITENEIETIKLGKRTAGFLKPGGIIALTGDLGTGKTSFVKGIAEGLLISKQVTSPTFTLVKSYEGCDIILHHFDVYRVHEEDDLFEIGFEEYLYKGDICVIEWADLIRNMLPPETIWIYLERTGHGTDERRIRIEGIEGL